MQLRPLGNSGLRISALGFGCMGLVGWYGTRDDAEAHATLVGAVAAGINHFDTAAAYQNGDNERFVGPILRPQREQLVIATKYGISRDASGAVRIDNRPESLRKSCDASLERLGIDSIDLFYLHRIDTEVPIEDSVGTLAGLIEAGKIRHIGLSECSVATLKRASAVHPIAAVQSEYSLWSRDPERGMLDTCRALGVAFVAYSPLGRGFLAGNFRRLTDLPASDVRRLQPRFQDANVEHNLRLADLVRGWAERKGCTPAQFAIAWVLAQGEHISVIPGMKTRAHLNDNLGALSVSLSAPELRELRAALDRFPVQGSRQPPGMMEVVDR